MSSYIISQRQLLGSVIMIAIFLATVVGFTVAFFDYFNQPEVYLDGAGKCIKVINFRNGDGYSCQDVNVTLRKYTTVHAS